MFNEEVNIHSLERRRIGLKKLKIPFKDYLIGQGAQQCCKGPLFGQLLEGSLLSNMRKFRLLLLFLLLLRPSLPAQIPTLEAQIFAFRLKAQP